MAAEIQEAPIKGNDNAGAAKGNIDSVRQQGNSPEAKGIIDAMKGPGDTSGYLNPNISIGAPERDANAAQAPAKPSEASANPTEVPAGKDSGSAQGKAEDSQNKGNGNDQPAQGGPVEAPAGKDTSSSQGNPDDPSVIKRDVVKGEDDQPAQGNAAGGQDGRDANAQPGQGKAVAGEWERSATDLTAAPVFVAFERSATDPDDHIISTGAQGGNDSGAQPAQGDPGDGQSPTWVAAMPDATMPPSGGTDSDSPAGWAFAPAEPDARSDQDRALGAPSRTQDTAPARQTA